MFDGFRSRWTIPFSCAASSASAICRAMAIGLVYRQRPLRDALGQRLAVDQLEDEKLVAVCFMEVVDGGDVRMVQSGEYLRFPPEPRHALDVAGESVWKGLESDMAIEFRIAGAVDLAHAARTDGGFDFVHAQTRPPIKAICEADESGPDSSRPRNATA